MRIWSLHPKYLDTKGLVALWRETLLAKHVLEGKTKGYKNHPQLDRFKTQNNPLDCINYYLSEVHKEATQRGYNFDESKISWDFKPVKIQVTSGQLAYETNHLLNKLKTREPNRYKEVSSLSTFEPHPIFTIVEGDIETWEVV